MKSYYDILKDHTEAHPPNYGDCDARSILEMLWNCYCQHNQLDSKQIKTGFSELYRHMKDVPIPDMDGIIDTVCTLCWEHERAGFVADTILYRIAEIFSPLLAISAPFDLKIRILVNNPFLIRKKLRKISHS